MPKVGEVAPDFELLDQDGNTVKLSDFRGKKVILFAYPAADTPGCTKQACGFRDNFLKVDTSNAVVLGISPDEVADLNKWKAKEKLPYNLLSDTTHEVLDQWGAWGEKNMFGKMSMGVIRSHWVIDEEGKILDERIKVSPEDSVKLAVEAVEKA